MSEIIDIDEHEIIELTPVDKSGWGPGPWQDEPDRIEWEHAGRPCLMVRNTQVSGAWCGYAAVDPGHPWHGLNYSRIEIERDEQGGLVVREADRPSPESIIDVHGGLTYSGACRGSVCHVAKAGQPEDVWWFGFDCAHGFDLSPLMEVALNRARRELGMPSLLENPRHEVYRDVAYVQAQVNSLAEQLNAHDHKALGA